MSQGCWHEAAVFGVDDAAFSLNSVLYFLSSHHSLYNDNVYSAVGLWSFVTFSFLSLQGLIAKFALGLRTDFVDLKWFSGSFFFFSLNVDF